MARPKSKAPSLRYHISGNSVVTIDGRDIYLGPHNSPESLARYAVLISRYQSGGLTLPEDFDVRCLDDHARAILGATIPTQQAQEPLTVRHVTAAYRDFAKKRYANSPKELHRQEQVCDQLEESDGDLLADKYGPLALGSQREVWIESGISRQYANRLTNLVVRIFKKAVSLEIVQESTWRRLQSLEPLRAGETKAHETKKIKPVAIEHVAATCKHLTPILRDMVKLQALTAMRPSEVCSLRPCDVDRSGSIWFWRPVAHKTAQHGILKSVPLLGEARAIVENYLNRPSETFCFSPVESVAWRNAQRRQNRKTKVQPSQQNRRVESPRKQPRDHFDVDSYRRAITAACKRAGIKKWHPYQLRHTGATDVSATAGAEAARALLGHSKLDMTTHYAQSTDQQAVIAAERLEQSLKKSGLV